MIRIDASRCLATVALAWVASTGTACERDVTKPRKATPTASASAPSSSAAAERATVPDATANPRTESAVPSQPSARPSDRLADGLRARPLAEQREYLLQRLEEEFALPARAIERVRQIVGASDWLGFGNPKMSEPAMTQAECRARQTAASVVPGDAMCPARNMVVVYDPATQKREDARVCIDQFEFPNIPCEYPIVWVRASEAEELCGALGKRLCWAHEWEGACAGALRPTNEEYPYAKLPKVYEAPAQVRGRRLQLEYLHNDSREVVWAYGKDKAHERCATSSRKSPSCAVVDYGTCGTNDYPAGSFPDCKSPFGVYDQHGNAAEHMSLPVYPKELAQKSADGWTEMKGSWFIFSRGEAHPDDCRWRAKNWHTTRVSDPQSHRNYHLGFRCCSDLPVPPGPKGSDQTPRLHGREEER